MYEEVLIATAAPPLITGKSITEEGGCYMQVMVCYA